MEFDVSKITYDNIMAAVNRIEKQKLPLHPSTGYDVIVDGKKYPPKEVIRYAYRGVTKKDPGRIYSGQQANNILQELGFTIEPKAEIWKLGCNWGPQAPSFYELIKRENIVISSTEYVFEKGDLVIITEGFTAYAIARVTEAMKSVVENESFEASFDEHSIEYDTHILYGPAEWYILPETEIFQYELRQGIRNVKRQDIREKAIDLWENRGAPDQSKLFYVRSPSHSPDESWPYPILVFKKNNWDDRGFTTTFDLHLYRTKSDKTLIGMVKILDRHVNETILPPTFRQLAGKYCSLGQTLEYYKRLKTEFPRQYENILRQLNDCAFFDDIRTDFEEERGYVVSLIRSTEAALVEREAKRMIGGWQIEDRYQFDFSCQIGQAAQLHSTYIEFNSDPNLPNRFFCIVGKNGTGKTRYLAELAKKLTDDSATGTFSPARPAFSKVIAASFSYFDHFEPPQPKDTSYEFIGVKTEKGLLSPEDSARLVYKASLKIADNKEKKDLWLKSMKQALETEYLGFPLEEFINISSRDAFIKRVTTVFSSGQNIVFQFVTRFLAVVEDNSLLLFDEPETHLHPNIAGRLLRSLANILEKCRSVCILSTHSPIIVQEIPSRYIRVFDRYEDAPSIYSPRIECFGENLSNISNSIFEADQEKEIYKMVLEEMGRTRSQREIDRIFENRLSLNAQLFIQSIKDSSNNA